MKLTVFMPFHFPLIMHVKSRVVLPNAHVKNRKLKSLFVSFRKSRKHILSENISSLKHARNFLQRIKDYHCEDYFKEQNL